MFSASVNKHVPLSPSQADLPVKRPTGETAAGPLTQNPSPLSPGRRTSAPPVMVSHSKILGFPRQVSSQALALNPFEFDAEFDLASAAALETDSTTDQFNAVVLKLDHLWTAVCQSAGEAGEAGEADNTSIATQQDNLATMEARIKQDIADMRVLLTRAAATDRQTIPSLFTQRPQISRNAEQAFAIAKAMCQVVKPYCSCATWQLFDTMQRDLHTLTLRSAFAASLADIDCLFAPHTVRPVRQTLPLDQPISAHAGADAQSEDELDKLIAEYSDTTALASPSASLPSVPMSPARVTTPLTGWQTPNSFAGSQRSPNATLAFPITTPTLDKSVIEKPQIDTPQTAGALDLVASRPRALSSPVLTAPRPPSLTQRPMPAPREMRILRFSRSRQSLRSPASAPVSPRKKAAESVAEKPSKSATPAREVIGFAAAQLHWFRGTPAEFLELYKYNEGVLKFLGFSRFANQPWKPELLALARALHSSLKKIDEYFLVNSALALQETNLARAHALSLEERFIDLCAEKKWTTTEQVALFTARNLNWNCIKIMGRTLQSLTVRENLTPRAVRSYSRVAPPEGDALSSKPAPFRLPLSRPSRQVTSALQPVALPAALPTQTLIRTQVSVRLPRHSGALSAPVSPRQPQRSEQSISQAPAKAILSGPVPALDKRDAGSPANVRAQMAKEKQ